jgi:ribonuclease T2
VEDMLPIMPDRGLIQHEWRAHGSCSGLSPSAYFGAIKRAFYRIKIPSEFSERGKPIRTAPEQVEQSFQSAAGFREAGSVRVACRQGELTEVRVCLSRNLEPIPCSNEVRECRMPAVSVRPIP